MGSSRVIRRTTTLVSIARIARSHVPADALFHLFDTSGFRRMCAEQLPMNVLRTEASCATDDDLVVLFVPFQDGTRTDAQPSADVRRDGNLSLGCDLGAG